MQLWNGMFPMSSQILTVGKLLRKWPQLQTGCYKTNYVWFFYIFFQVPAWIRNELQFSEQESKDDGNEADDTSDQSDDALHRRVVDSSMSNIQINKDLAPSMFSAIIHCSCISVC